MISGTAVPPSGPNLVAPYSVFSKSHSRNGAPVCCVTASVRGHAPHHSVVEIVTPLSVPLNRATSAGPAWVGSLSRVGFAVAGGASP